MEKIKKITKELRIYGIVLICVLGLFLYKQVNLNNYITISSAEAVEMLKSKKDFILVLGTSKISNTTDSTTSSDPGVLTKEQATFQKAYIKKHRQKVYYLDTNNIENVSTFITTNFTNDTTIPQTLFIKDGEIVINKSGVIKYVEFSELVNEWKNK